VAYNNSLLSKANKDICLSFPEMNILCGRYFHPQGGSTLIKTEMERGIKKPTNALRIAAEFVMHLLSINEKLHVSVLTFYIETTRALQKAIYQTVGNNKNLLVETVSRVQGLTTDVAIYVIPNTGYNFLLEKRLFNVATSRAKRHTIIIADKHVAENKFIDEEVRSYLERLDKEFSFDISPQLKMLESRVDASNDKIMSIAELNEYKNI
jgi:superfamily I DNA and/or RNA helicase